MRESQGEAGEIWPQVKELWETSGAPQWGPRHAHIFIFFAFRLLDRGENVNPACSGPPSVWSRGTAAPRTPKDPGQDFV